VIAGEATMTSSALLTFALLVALATFRAFRPPSRRAVARGRLLAARGPLLPPPLSTLDLAGARSASAARVARAPRPL
jgi:hypothetical protein